MGTRLDPYLHKHDTAEEPEANDRALSGHIEHARDNTKPRVPHHGMVRGDRLSAPCKSLAGSLGFTLTAQIKASGIMLRYVPPLSQYLLTFIESPVSFRTCRSSLVT